MLTSPRPTSRLAPAFPASLSAWPGDHHCVFCNLIASIDYAIKPTA
jgi:hypothetical protein